MINNTHGGEIMVSEGKKKEIVSPVARKLAVYKKPVLQKYGSISAITAGRNGSISDHSKPGNHP